MSSEATTLRIFISICCVIEIFLLSQVIKMLTALAKVHFFIFVWNRSFIWCERIVVVTPAAYTKYLMATDLEHSGCWVQPRQMEWSVSCFPYFDKNFSPLPYPALLFQNRSQPGHTRSNRFADIKRACRFTNLKHNFQAGPNFDWIYSNGWVISRVHVLCPLFD